MSKGIYYTAPSDASFEEMKSRAIDLWQEYDDTYGYATDKISRLNDMQNIEDNFMFIFAMFDMENQRKIVSRIHPRTRADLRKRMVDGGNSPFLITSLGL